MQRMGIPVRIESSAIHTPKTKRGTRTTSQSKAKKGDSKKTPTRDIAKAKKKATASPKKSATPKAKNRASPKKRKRVASASKASVPKASADGAPPTRKSCARRLSTGDVLDARTDDAPAAERTSVAALPESSDPSNDTLDSTKKRKLPVFQLARECNHLTIRSDRHKLCASCILESGVAPCDGLKLWCEECYWYLTSELFWQNYRRSVKGKCSRNKQWEMIVSQASAVEKRLPQGPAPDDAEFAYTHYSRICA